MKKVDLLDRYLQAIGFWLPKKEKTDIMAELSEDIQMQIAERESDVGRELDETELEALLKERGNPLHVAGHYLPQKQLIGPAIFPLYMFVLKLVAYLYLLPGITVWLCMALFVPSYRADHSSWELYKALLFWLWPGALYLFAIITIHFAIFEKIDLPAKWRQTWSLGKLPVIRDALEISRSSSLGNIVGALCFVLWWFGWIKFPAVMIHTSDATQAWTGGTFWRSFHSQFFWPVLAFLLAYAALGIVNFLHPYRTRVRLACWLAINSLNAIFLFIVLKINWSLYQADQIWLSGHKGAEVNALMLGAISNVVVFWIVAGTAIVCVASSLMGIWRLLRFGAWQNRHAGLLGVFVLILLLSGGLYSQEAKRNEKSSVAIPSDDEIYKLLKERVDTQHKGTGMVVGIVTPQGRRLICFGKPGQNDARPLNGDTIFEIGSITKVFTSLLLADMVKHGEVALDDPVAKHLEKGVKVPQWQDRQITLIDLSTQTSGLPFFPTDFPLIEDIATNFKAVASYSSKQLYTFLSHYELLHDIGVHWEYSNLGVGLLGLALAHRAHTDYESLVRVRITGPLGLRSTAVTVSPEMKARLANGYDATLQPALETDMPVFAAAGSLRSSANDLLTFLSACMGDTPSPLSPAMHAMLETSRPSDEWLAYLGGKQALGWWIIGSDDDQIIAHAGGTMGFSSSAAFNPKTHTGVVALANGDSGGTDLAMHLLRPSYPLSAPEAPKERNEIVVDPKLFDIYAGKYQCAPNVILVIKREDGKLTFMAPGSPRVSLHAQGERDYFIANTDVAITFQVDGQGHVTGLILHLYSQFDIPAQRIAAGPKVKN